jgi:hypothetical protein
LPGIVPAIRALVEVVLPVKDLSRFLKANSSLGISPKFFALSHIEVEPHLICIEQLYHSTELGAIPCSADYTAAMADLEQRP